MLSQCECTLECEYTNVNMLLECGRFICEYVDKMRILRTNNLLQLMLQNNK